MRVHFKISSTFLFCRFGFSRRLPGKVETGRSYYRVLFEKYGKKVSKTSRSCKILSNVDFHLMRAEIISITCYCSNNRTRTNLFLKHTYNGWKNENILIRLFERVNRSIFGEFPAEVSRHFFNFPHWLFINYVFVFLYRLVLF